MKNEDVDIILLVGGGRFANVVVNTENARTLSREADVFFASLSPFVALMQNDEGTYGFVDADEVAESGVEPARLAYPLEVARFLNWFGRKWNAERPLRAIQVDESFDDAFSQPPPARMRLRAVPQRITRRGRRDP